MSTDLTVTPSLVIPGVELAERFSRSSGPGGQSVNTTDSRVELSFDVARSSAFTSERQRERALDRLAALLREAIAPPPPPRRATKPSRGARERRLAAKRQRSDVKRGRGQVRRTD